MKRMSIVAVFTALAIAAPAMAEGHGRGTFVVPPGPRPAVRRIHQTNDRVVTINGRRCVQTPGRFGTVRTVCADGDHDRDDRIVARADRRDDRRFDDRFDHRFDRRDADWKKHKHKKHKHDKHDDHHDNDGRFRR